MTPPTMTERARAKSLKKQITNILGEIGAEMDGPYGDDAMPVVRADDVAWATDAFLSLLAQVRKEALEEAIAAAVAKKFPSSSNEGQSFCDGIDAAVEAIRSIPTVD